MSTKQQFLYTVVVDGQSLGVFDTFTGGVGVSPESKHRPGGMGDEESLPTLPSYTMVQVTREYQRERDHELLRSLQPKSGRVTASVTEQPLDDDGNAWGNPNVYSGRFLGPNRGDADSESSDPRMLELDISVTTVV